MDIHHSAGQRSSTPLEGRPMPSPLLEPQRPKLLDSNCWFSDCNKIAGSWNHKLTSNNSGLSSLPNYVKRMAVSVFFHLLSKLEYQHELDDTCAFRRLYGLGPHVYDLVVYSVMVVT